MQSGSATTMVFPSQGTKHIGGCCHVKRLENVYAKLGMLDEAHVEGMRSSNPVLMGYAVIMVFLLNLPLYMLVSL